MDLNEIDKILTDQVESGKTPSAQYYFFDKDSVIKSFQVGLSDISKEIKVDSSTTYNAFSVTKTFTALAVLQLAENGEIDINSAVSQYLSDFIYGEEITVKQLLNHTGGLPNPIPLNWIHLDTEHKTFDRHTFFKSILEKNNKTRSEPNAKFSYSNLGYVVLGELIEDVSGETYEDYITKHIINKLPIDSNDLTFEIVNKKRHAKGYHKKLSFSNLILGFLMNKSKYMGESEGKWRSFKSFYINGPSYGGLIGTPTSFIAYLQEMLKTNSDLLSDEYKQMLFRENMTHKGKNTGMCLSWFSGDLDGKKYVAHAGGGGGYYCEIRVYPDLKKGSVLFFNRTGMSDERFLDKLDKYFMNE
ncbi:serine hydrolase domain-containing protein [[Muricauda] lutisoli]|uniref:Beta-lactamase family protein n=1 Tax=[Muricauda] lutisoli TaxID=2816035 RepID=A0ABS3EW89_9FLAO|nr:serine hydrolase domain-containing protein [[Muricauda] lutisoli]MBO0330509.1 beta-lactamase family protein [[Muricauda] lutisoli]